MYSNLRDKSLLWDLIKMEIRRATIAYSKTQARLKREETELLAKQICHLEAKMSESPTTNDIEQYETLKAELDKIYTQKAAGHQVRAKATLIDFGEKNSKFFANLEKSRYKSKHITALNINNKDVTDPGEILREEKRFYENLYSKKAVFKSAQKVFLEENRQYINQLSNENKAYIDEPITPNEIASALKLLPNGKSPGSDGFTTEFYKMFWQQISPYVIDSFQHAYQNGRLSIDQRRGIITLTPKKAKDVKDSRNWRPISLLNTDFKILAKLFGLRMQKVLSKVISSDQVGYLPGRYIGQNIRLIQDVIDQCNGQENSGIVAFLDFEKAFDSVEWCFIQEALTIFNFGEGFKKWIDILYTDITACVINNGFSSETFKPTRGIRQGCPLSVYLFLLVVELLAIEIRSNDNINGIKVGVGTAKIAQMADDTTIFVRNHDSLQRIITVMNMFEQASGLRLNKGKTEAMWLGIKGHRKKGLGLKWQEDSIYALGIYFCHDLGKSQELNLSQSMEKCKKCLDTWSRRHLSLIGRITVIKSFALPKLLYAATNVPVSEPFITSVNDYFYNFLWEGKPDKIKRKTIEMEFDRGGLKMVNFKAMMKATKCMWVKRLLENKNATWTLYFQSFLDMTITDFFKCSFNKALEAGNLPLFYHQVCNAWAETKIIIPQDLDCWSIRREFIAYNKNLSAGGTYYNMHWGNELYKSNIKIIHDICKENGTILSKPEMENKYQIHISHLAYNSLVSAIPRNWKAAIRGQNIPENAINSSENVTLRINKTDRPLNTITNHDFYLIHVQHNTEKLKCQVHWESIFDINELDWVKYFTMAKVDRDVRMQSFQYKIIHRILPCNKYLSKWHDTITSECSYCMAEDDISHFLYCCPYTRPFWRKLDTWLQVIGVQQSAVSCKEVLFGLTAKKPHTTAINFTILQAKWYIFRKKINHDVLIWPEFVHDLKNRMEIERNVYVTKRKLNIFKDIYKHIIEFD